MELENLVHTLINILSDFGTIKTFITTENECRTYNGCEMKVLNIDGELYLKVEGKNYKEN